MIYQPLVINNELIKENKKRPLSVQQVRIDLFPDLSNKSVLDLGCNTAYLLRQLILQKNAKECVGVDINNINIKLNKLIN